MVGRSAQVSAGIPRLGSGGLVHPSGHTLLGEAPQGEDPATKEVRPEGRICVSAGRYVFVDPKWGPISFDFSIWRPVAADMPEYEVIIE